MNSDLVFAVDYSRILAAVLELTPDQIPQLLADTSLSAEHFMAMEGYITWPDQHQIIQNALALSNEPGLGLRAGEHYSLMTHGLMGVASMACPTVLDALQTLLRYHPTRAQFTRLELQQDAEQLVLYFDITVEQDPVAMFLHEALVLSLVATLRFLIGDRVQRVLLELAIDEPDYSELYRQRIPCQLRFGCARNRIIMPREFTTIAVPTHDANIQRWAVQQCEQQFAQLQEGTGFTARTLMVLRQSPGGTLSQEQVALMLNVSSRTLLRRLQEEGTTYRQLVDQEQQRLARYYLEHTQSTIETIAAQLGYHDQSSFRRAFKRWFGVLPSEYRR